MATTQHQPTRAAEPRNIEQYGLARILGTWAAAALPMATLAWLVAPRLAGVLSGPGALPRALILSLLAGLSWQFVLVVVLVHREQGTLRWWGREGRAVAARAAKPEDRPSRRGALVVAIPLIAALASRSCSEPADTAASRHGLFLGSEAGQAFLAGNWGWLRSSCCCRSSIPCSARSCCSGDCCCRG